MYFYYIVSLSTDPLIKYDLWHVSVWTGNNRKKVPQFGPSVLLHHQNIMKKNACWSLRTRKTCPLMESLQSKCHSRAFSKALSGQKTGYFSAIIATLPWYLGSGHRNLSVASIEVKKHRNSRQHWQPRIHFSRDTS